MTIVQSPTVLYGQGSKNVLVDPNGEIDVDSNRNPEL